MSLSNCVYPCMHKQHSVLPTAISYSLQGSRWLSVGKSLITCDIGIHDSLGLSMSPPLHTEVLHHG